MPAHRATVAPKKPEGLDIQVKLDLTTFELKTLADFRRLNAKYQRTTSSTPELELAKLYSALSTSAQILAETLDKPRAPRAYNHSSTVKPRRPTVSAKRPTAIRLA
jgi:hypothetical protein